MAHCLALLRTRSQGGDAVAAGASVADAFGGARRRRPCSSRGPFRFQESMPTSQTVPTLVEIAGFGQHRAERARIRSMSGQIWNDFDRTSLGNGQCSRSLCRFGANIGEVRPMLAQGRQTSSELGPSCRLRPMKDEFRPLSARIGPGAVKLDHVWATQGQLRLGLGRALVPPAPLYARTPMLTAVPACAWKRILTVPRWSRRTGSGPTRFDRRSRRRWRQFLPNQGARFAR